MQRGVRSVVNDSTVAQNNCIFTYLDTEIIYLCLQIFSNIKEFTCRFNDVIWKRDRTRCGFRLLESQRSTLSSDILGLSAFAIRKRITPMTSSVRQPEKVSVLDQTRTLALRWRKPSTSQTLCVSSVVPTQHRSQQCVCATVVHENHDSDLSPDLD